MSTLSPGALVGEYVIVRPLGEGGFGEVYEARDQRTQHRVALKVLHRASMSDTQRERFAREALISNRVSESSSFVPKVVRAAFDEQLERAWLAIEYIEGEPLSAATERILRWSWSEAREVLYCVAHALSAAHSSQLVHCDIKPENVMVRRLDTRERKLVAYVLDFGIARVRTDRATHAPSTMAATVQWAAPEQLDQRPVTPATDQYSFALVVFWMLVGAQFPRTEPDWITPSKWAAQRGVSLPAAFDQWYQRATRYPPNERFASIELAFSELERAFAFSPVATAPTVKASVSAFAPTQQSPPLAAPLPSNTLPDGGRARRRRVAALLLTALVAGAALVVVPPAIRRLSGEPAPTARSTHPMSDPRSLTPSGEWMPTAALTAIEPGFRPLGERASLRAAAVRWQRFVESYGGTDPSDVYLTTFRLRTQGTQSASQATRWWDEWRANGEHIWVSLDHARVLQRPVDTRPNADASQCHPFGSVFEMRVPVRELKPNMSEQQRQQIPCVDFQAIYTVRFVQSGRDFRVCHENWRSVDLCAACPAATGCS